MAPESDGETRSQIGARLRAARQRLGLSLLQAAEKLHVDLRVLEALENEEFSELGAAVFVRGHIRHYAELVGESPSALLDLYEASAHAVRAPDLTRVPSAEGARESRTLLVPGVTVVIAVGLIGSIWWVDGSLKGPPSEHEPASATAPGVPAAEQGGPGADAASSGPATAAATPGNGLAALAHVSTQAGGAAGNTPETGTATPPAAHAAEHPRITEITLHFAEDSWAEVYDAHGERLFYDIGPAGSVHSVHGTAPLRVVLGNAPGVTLEVNGRRAAMPDATADASLELQVNRSGRVSARLAAAQGHAP